MDRAAIMICPIIPLSRYAVLPNRVSKGTPSASCSPPPSNGVEYDHLFMGNNGVTFPASAIAVTRGDNIRQNVDMGTVRLNYRFGGL
jgi:hypothetical protein